MAIKKIFEQIIINNFPEATINIIDLAGDDNHFSLEIRSKKFNGLSRIKQHKWYMMHLTEKWVVNYMLVN